MTSDDTCSASAPTAHILQALFKAIDAPAALCRADFSVLMANGLFETLCEQKLLGLRLTDCLSGIDLQALPRDCEVTAPSGKKATLTIGRYAHCFVVVERRLSHLLDSLAATSELLMEQARIEAALLQTGRDVIGATSEEELVTIISRGLKSLLPRRAFCIRILDARSCELTSLYAEGQLRATPLDVFYLRQSMVEKTKLDLTGLPRERVQVIHTEIPHLFTDTSGAVSVPLVVSGKFFGALNVEHPKGISADLYADERTVIQLANQAAVAVRNAKLIDELRFVRKYLEELLENANALILATNHSGRIVIFNNALVQLTGFEKRAILGTDVAELIPPAERVKFLQAFNLSLKGAPLSPVETALLGKHGQEIRVTFSTSAVAIQSAEPEGVIAIGQDLTRMRKLEGHMIQAEKMASLGRLAASIVHEINNPMTAILTYADALLRRSLPTPDVNAADIQKYRRIIDNSERVLRLTSDLVSYARPAQDKPENIELAQLLDSAVALCEHLWTRGNISVRRHDAPLSPFLGVRQTLVQVFVNLITNACYATPAGGHITLQLAQENECAVISITDSGAGIAQDIQPYIFEPFFTTKPAGKGTGLGLSIAHSIIEKHGGSISVTSAPGQGSTFTIRLPMLYRRLAD